MLDFLPETAGIREDLTWRVAQPAPGLVDRRVEITGPTDKKMTLNALNSGANVWLADFEDANTPLWDNMITSQLNLKDALDRTIDFTSAEGKDYALRPGGELATIVVRPRGWHLDEKHILIDGVRASGSLTDFALYMATCAGKQIGKGKGPCFYLAKNESHLEARLWNDVFAFAERACGLPTASIRATVLIETLQALRNRLSTCIGCGCLSIDRCDLLNPDDEAAARGAGAHYLRQASDAELLADRP